jgi:hypothetical protein
VVGFSFISGRHLKTNKNKYWAGVGKTGYYPVLRRKNFPFYLHLS